MDDKDESSAPNGNNAKDKTGDAGTSKGEDGAKPGKKSDGKSNGRKRKITIAIVAVLLVVGIVGGIAYYLYASQYVTTDDAFVDGQIVYISAQQSGQLTEVPIVANTEVAKGDLLARIDGATVNAALATAKAQAPAATAAVAEAEAAVVSARTGVESAQSQLDGAQVASRNAAKKADRFTRLAEKSGQTAISAQDLDDTVAAAEQAASAVETARAQVAAAKSQVTSAQATLKSAQAKEGAAKAQVDQAQVNVDQLAITAPIDGQVVQVNVNVGSYVSPGVQLMAMVPDNLYVTANFKETQLADIQPGQKVDLKIDAFPDVDFKGTVQSIQNGAGQAFQLLPPQNATGNFVKVVQRVPVRISIDKPSLKDYPIGPGMSVVPSILLED